MADPIRDPLRSPRVLIALGMVVRGRVLRDLLRLIAPHDPGDQNLLSILTPPAGFQAAIRIICLEPTALAATCCHACFTAPAPR